MAENFENENNASKEGGIARRVAALKSMLSDWKKLPDSWMPQGEIISVPEEKIRNKFRRNYFQQTGSICLNLAFDYLSSEKVGKEIEKDINRLFSDIKKNKNVSEKQIDEMDRIANETIKAVENL